MTRAGVGDAVVSAQVVLRRRHLRANPIARHAVRVVCLVHDARGAAGAQDVAARFWQRQRGREKKKSMVGAVSLSGLAEGDVFVR